MNIVSVVGTRDNTFFGACLSAQCLPNIDLNTHLMTWSWLLFVYRWKELVECQVRTSVGWFFGVNNGSLPVFRLDIYRFSIPGDYHSVKSPPPKLTWKINKSWYLHLEPTQQKQMLGTHPWNPPSKNVKCQRTWK